MLSRWSGSSWRLEGARQSEVLMVKRSQISRRERGTGSERRARQIDDPIRDLGRLGEPLPREFLFQIPARVGETRQVKVGIDLLQNAQSITHRTRAARSERGVHLSNRCGLPHAHFPPRFVKSCRQKEYRNVEGRP